ncbi:TIGR00725 family protein [Rapidithrix thailandica]|uniref:TIGR00725 family protein n=1 Tax=Rapidithrix thailandica TaxID=413964 RepID=A0AAW9S717_9BACT
MKPLRLPQATVIGDSETDEATYQMGEKIGQILAELSFTVITGGRGGIMEAVSKGAHDNGGTVVGILPGSDLSQANPYCHIVIPTGMGHTRNALTTLAADVVVAVGGGAGTLSEITFAWLYHKPILALTGKSGWADELAGTRLDQRRIDLILPCYSLEDLQQELTQISDNFG